MKKYIIVSLILSLLIFTSCWKNKKTQIDESKIVARVNDDVLTIDDIKDSFGPYADYLTEKQKEDYINDWIKTTLLYQEALRRHLDKDPELMKRIENMKKVILTSYLQESVAQSVPPASDSEIEDYFNKHEKEYNTKITISYIVVDTKEEADSIKNLLLNGARFSKIARELGGNNPDGSHTIGPFRWGEEIWLPEDVMEAAFSIDVIGKVVGPIPTSIGYVFVQLKKKQRVRKKITVDDVREEIREKLTSQKIEERIQEWIKEMESNSIIEKYPDRIGRR